MKHLMPSIDHLQDDEVNPSLGTYRLGGGRVVAWWIIALVGVMALSGLVAQTGRNRVISVALCLAVMAVSYLLGVRPCVMERPDGLLVLNPIRTIHVPWSLVTDVRLKDVVIIGTVDEQIRCYGLPRRERRSAAAVVNARINARIPMGSESAAPGPNLSGSVVDLIRDHAEAFMSGAPEGVSVSRAVDRDVAVALITLSVALLCAGFSIWA